MVLINTSRLMLRDLHEDDRRALHPIFSDPKVTRYIDWIKSNSVSQTQRWLQETMLHNAKQPRLAYNLAISRQSDACVLGWIGIGRASNPSLGDLDFGYALGQPFWGRGYMSEALRGLLDFSFRELAVQKIFGECEVANLASAQVMEKAGMQLEVQFQVYDEVTGRVEENLRYSIIDHDWQKSTEAKSH